MDIKNKVETLSQLEKGREYFVYKEATGDEELSEIGYLVGVMNVQITNYGNKTPVGLFKDKNNYGYFTKLLKDYKVGSLSGGGHIEPGSDKKESVVKSGDKLAEKIRDTRGNLFGLSKLEGFEDLS